MRKRIKFRKLGRTGSHKWAMLRNMVTSLIKHERIVTTVPKAKELKYVADHVVTLAKKQFIPNKKIHAIQQANAIVREKPVLTKLFEVLGPRYKERQGGYTRILKLSRPRQGDKAPMAVMEYVDRPGELRAARPPASLQQPEVLADVLREMGITPLRDMDSAAVAAAVADGVAEEEEEDEETPEGDKAEENAELEAAASQTDTGVEEDATSESEDKVVSDEGAAELEENAPAEVASQEEEEAPSHTSQKQETESPPEK